MKEWRRRFSFIAVPRLADANAISWVVSRFAVSEVLVFPEAGTSLTISLKARPSKTGTRAVELVIRSGKAIGAPGDHESHISLVDMHERIDSENRCHLLRQKLSYSLAIDSGNSGPFTKLTERWISSNDHAANADIT